jgi:hypothetical protein
MAASWCDDQLRVIALEANAARGRYSSEQILGDLIGVE